MIELSPLLHLLETHVTIPIAGFLDGLIPMPNWLDLIQTIGGLSARQWLALALIITAWQIVTSIVDALLLRQVRFALATALEWLARAIRPVERSRAATVVRQHGDPVVVARAGRDT